jgi:hypothetical protein
MIRHLHCHQIDRQRWDACVRTSASPLIYAECWYLDIVAPGWEGLVADDYRAVFPLPVRRRWGVKYVFQPLFNQQLGSFGEKDADVFLNEIPTDIRLVDIQLNSSNSCHSHSSQQRPNLMLSLGESSTSIRSRYSENLRRNIRKAEKAGLPIHYGLDIHELIDVFKSFRGRSVHGIEESDYQLLLRLSEEAGRRGLVETAGISDPEGKLMAGAVFLKSPHGWIFLFSAITPEAREIGAMSAIIDDFIGRHAGEDTLLDFEGSADPNLYRFYKSFGSTESVYLRIRINRLPFPLRLLKRPL